MEGNVITAGIQLLRAFQQPHPLIQAGHSAISHRQCIAPNLHAQSQGCIGNFYTNVAQAHHTQSLALNFGTCKLFFCFFGVFCQFGVLAVLPGPGNAAHHITSA